MKLMNGDPVFRGRHPQRARRLRGWILRFDQLANHDLLRSLDIGAGHAKRAGLPKGNNRVAVDKKNLKCLWSRSQIFANDLSVLAWQ